MKRMVLLAAVLGAAASNVAAEMLVVRGATLHPVTAGDIPNGTLIVEDGRITSVGTGGNAPSGARVVDATGMHVYPGLIDANTVLGLVEVSSVRGTVDVSETGDVNPNARAEVALNADSELLPVTRANGVLLAMTAPRGGLLAGSAAVIRMDGWNWEDLTVRAPVGVLVNWPSMRIDYRPEASRSVEDQVKTRDERLAALRSAFANARAYHAAQGAAGKSGVPRHDEDLRWTAMGAVLRREIPVFVVAAEFLALQAAMHWAEEEGVDLVLISEGDVGRLAPELARRRIRVILDPVWELPQRRWEPYDTPFTNAALLHAAGVPFCFATGANAFGAANARNLPYEAAQAVAYGLPREVALRSLTQTAAEILGVGDRVGSLAPGKQATFFIADGDPLDIRTQVTHAFIDGREVSLETRHTRLRDKYRSRPRPAAESGTNGKATGKAKAGAKP